MSKWKSRLDAAASQEEVLDLVREYVRTLSEMDIARLPGPCRPGELRNAEDVKAFAFALVRHDCHGDGATARLVANMFDVFSRAERRLARLSEN